MENVTGIFSYILGLSLVLLRQIPVILRPPLVDSLQQTPRDDIFNKRKLILGLQHVKVTVKVKVKVQMKKFGTIVVLP